MGLETLGQLNELSEDCIVQVAGLTLATVKAVDWLTGLGTRAAILDIEPLKYLEAYPSARPNLGEYVQSTVQSLVEASRKGQDAERKAAIFAERMGVMTGRPKTLEECGNAYGVTRERIRQLENRTIKGVGRATVLQQLWPVALAVWCSLLELGGAADLESVNQRLSINWDVPEQAKYLRSVAKFFPDFREANGSDNAIVLASLHCADCEVFTEAIGQVAESDEVVNPSELATIMCSRETNCSSRCRLSLPPSEVTVRDALSQVDLESRGLGLSRAGLYRQEPGRRDPSSRAGQLLEILRLAGHPMHFKEICEKANEQTPHNPFTSSHVYSRLDGLDDAVSWDSGSFIHIRNMPYPYGLVRKTEEWIRQRFRRNDYLPFVSSNGPFSEYEDEFLRAGVPSALAVYSLLRISGERAFTFPRYPYVYRSHGFDGRLPLAAAMGEYVRRAGDVVAASDLRRWVTEEMGFRSYQFDQRIEDIPNVFMTMNGFVHRDNVPLDEATVTSLMQYAEALVRQDGHVSVERVFNDRRVDCLLSGIKDQRFLYSVLQAQEPAVLSVERYPVLSLQTAHATSSAGVTGLIVEYLRKTGRPVSLDELEKEFVTKRHYNPRTVYAVAYRKEVVRQASTSLMHSDVLGWSEGQWAQFELAATTLFDKVIARGELVAKAEDLVESNDLPPLPDGVLWTSHLASDLIDKSQRFRLIGNARSAFVAADNDARIANLGDLATRLVKEKFGGGVSLSELEHCLRATGALTKGLNPPLLGASPGVQIVGFEVRLVGAE